MAVITVGGDHGIGRSHGGDAADGDRFLTVVDVQKPARQLVLIRLHGANFDPRI